MLLEDLFTCMIYDYKRQYGLVNIDFTLAQTQLVISPVTVPLLSNWKIKFSIT